MTDETPNTLVPDDGDALPFGGPMTAYVGVATVCGLASVARRAAIVSIRSALNANTISKLRITQSHSA